MSPSAALSYNRWFSQIVTTYVPLKKCNFSVSVPKPHTEVSICCVTWQPTLPVYLQSFRSAATSHDVQLCTPSVSLPLQLLFEYQNKHVIFGLIYVMLKFSTRISYRGVPGFATSCPCDVWCRWLATSSRTLDQFLEMMIGLKVWHNGEKPFHCF